MTEHEICKTCVCNKACAFLKKRGVNPISEDSVSKVKATNADRIRAMSDKELAEFLMKPTRIIPKYECEDCENDCTECVLEWLKKEVDDGKV